MSEHHLQGGCSCGRNQYEIALPQADEARVVAQVLFGRAHSSSLPTLLRVPLPYLQSTTYAFTPHERPVDIKRIFSPSSSPQTKRNFCGFCGTPLTYWTEEQPGEADFICINLASLERGSLNLLDTLGVLPTVDDESDEAVETNQGQNLQPSDIFPSNDQRLIHGEPWFEELIQTGPLGRLKKRRGGKKSADGRSVVEWEIIEMEGEEGLETQPKRQMTGATSTEDEKMDG